MSEKITKDHLDAVVMAIKQDTKDQIGSLRTGLDTRFDAIESRLEPLEDDIFKVKHAVLDYLGTDRALHNLVTELHAKGVPVDVSKIFVV